MTIIQTSAMLLLLAAPALAADTGSAPLSVADRMRASIAKQREAIGRQGGAPVGSFFSTAWVVATSLPVNAASPGLSSATASCEPLPEDKLTELIADAAKRDGVNPQLIRAVIRRESGARPCAVSEKGAQGLMQLMPATQQDLGVKDAFDPVENVMGGTRYLSDLLKRYKGDLRRTLAAYNAGPQRVDPDGPVPDIPETRAYLDAVLAEVTPAEPAPPPQP